MTISGVILLDKPLGVTSNKILQKIKRLYNAKKAGHTGSLDPLATGMLPICFGEATKFSQYLLDADKKYLATAKLGVKTDTSDSEGKIIQTKPVENVSEEKIESVLKKFRGKTKQIPSMYSALKYKGKPLYEYAREGVEIEREPRDIEVLECELTALSDDEFSIRVHCSKGTYIRNLVEDIGDALGCGAHVIALRRTSIAHFSEAQMHPIDDFDEAVDEYLLPIDVLLEGYPEIVLSPEQEQGIKFGRPIDFSNIPDSETIRIYNDSGDFLGIAKPTSEGKITPKRLISNQLA